MSAPDQRGVNEAMWSAAGAGLVREYASEGLRPVETSILARHREALGGRVMEIGVGAGRLTAPLLGIAGELRGIDISAAMVEHCRRRFPAASFVLADLADPLDVPDGGLEAVFAGFNVIDVLDEVDRVRVLAEWNRAVAAGGLLVFSSHNLAYAPRIRSPWRLLARRPRAIAGNALSIGRRVRNRARLAPLQRHGDGWAVLVDEGHDFSLLHYYATRDHVEAQLREAGFALLECLDLDGNVVRPGEAAEACPELHYVARAAA